MDNTKQENKSKNRDNNKVVQSAAKPIIAITAGDPNGVGYEILLKAVSHPHILEICRPVVYGNIQVARKHLQYMDEEMQNLQFNLIDSPRKAANGKISFINCYADNLPLNIGKSTKEAGEASYLSLQRACKDIQEGNADALVTAPINKENIQSEQFTYSGHTEYLTHLFAGGHDSLMMMVSDQMRVALVCNHVALSKVPLFITEERILAKLDVLNRTLQNDFTIRKPRIAVLALNPHAGDNGLIGKEEQDIIKPAIEKAQANGVMAFGPYSADGFFGAGHYRSFDAVLGMYHDQGLIPFKSLDMSGVNFTAGLDIIRTSPDHGTAYALAGKNEADATSFQHALYMAIDLIRTRAQNKELHASILQVESPSRERREQKA
ncbi:MAG: 4-hydroxythreonine-4-phosphate dehydrogenase PdxA [Paludibacter sp.]|nr:4-hydroxythreonine-4-phosphate dehydrogenase PdxA [Bacteroidales bacterium]MCM1068928.1 4-hydroxythreonine-4-phosphate dehydrogenase PdxA [Prevotella sp.]MCM1353189.1 4-hydroxythreonine-4-phosphate dehydrogenase PdxA [Bacteroides sp.]MCM1442511.1 4-hydroxythreonine-4-phosphate dehydrogenase PdxA [Muribaculum sp.]MCM1481354.1 4-hydroxythreonine-4-phosphate dehydrogenase PdxA [Paludibacter sp.]